MKKFSWAQFKRGMFVVNCLAVIFDSKTGKFLIGRREKDHYIKKLRWQFPGGRPAYRKNLEDYLKLEVKRKTSLRIKVKDVIFARTYPENRRFLSVYYLAEVAEGKEKAGEKFAELKWTTLKEIKRCFTPAIHPALYKKLLCLARK